MGVSSMSSGPRAESPLILGGLDILRLVAMALVTVQHALTLTSHDRWTTFRSINVGQLGVALFLGISALLGSLSHRPPVPWLMQRLRRLYPAYWLTMAACFALVWITRYKRFGWGLVASQMLGLGLFTHGENLINVPTWFISLLLVCYFALFLGRLSRRPLLFDVLLIAAILAGEVTLGLRWPWLHLLTFFAASALTLASPKGLSARSFAAAGAGLLLLARWSPAFVYTGLTLLSIGLTLYLPGVPRFFRKIAGYSYEYYLVHGLFLIGTTTALPRHPAVATAVGVALATLGAVVLNGVVARILATRRIEYPATSPSPPGHSPCEPDYRRGDVGVTPAVARSFEN
jgi:peptidoglycan/LPS O-acetylase OafA/YrhL